MNDLKKMLQRNTTKLIDEKIRVNIENELNKLEEIAVIEKYKEQIRNRKEGISSLLNNFDNNMVLIEDRVRYTNIDRKTSKIKNDIYFLDIIIKRKIVQLMDRLSNKSNRYNNEQSSKELAQIMDRRMKIENLLEDYEENMKFFKRNIELQQNLKAKSKTR